MPRGQLNEEVANLIAKRLGMKVEDVTVRHVRLMPYLMSRILDNSNIDPIRINGDERQILIDWQNRGFLHSPTTGLKVTSEFYDHLCAILKVSYASDMLEQTNG